MEVESIRADVQLLWQLLNNSQETSCYGLTLTSELVFYLTSKTAETSAQLNNLLFQILYFKCELT